MSTSPKSLRVIVSRTVRFEENVARMGKLRVGGFVFENRKVRDLLGYFARILKENIQIYLNSIRAYRVSAYYPLLGFCENSNERDIRIYYGGEYQDSTLYVVPPCSLAVSCR